MGTSTMPVPSSGADAVLQLESLLGLHTILASDMMRARVRTDPDLAQSANAALGQNTQAMGAVLKPVIGAEATEQFAAAWTEHIQALFNYARGLATRDASVRKAAHDKLIEHEAGLARFFAAQSDGRLKLRAARATVRQHVNLLVRGAEMYAAKKYAASARSYRRSYAHAFEVGGILGHTLWPPEVGAELDSPALTLRASLTHLLGEHVALMIATIRSAVGDEEDFEAMGAAVNNNTLAITGAFDSLFGPAAARQFQTRWADHVDHLMDYTAARVKNDAAGQRNARQGLQNFENAFAGFLSNATQNRIRQSDMVGVFVDYDRRLLAEVDAYAANDHEQALALRQQLYGATFAIAQQLSKAIGATLAAQLPRGGSQTGDGGMAVRVQDG
jgi:hypothetical protein